MTLATATKRRTKKPALPQVSPWQLAVSTVAAKLAAYREHVDRAARGELIMGDDMTRLEAVMGELKLPGYAWARDVRATRQYRNLQRQLAAVTLTAGDQLQADLRHRQNELEWNHPHLWRPVEIVAAERVAERQNQ